MIFNKMYFCYFCCVKFLKATLNMWRRRCVCFTMVLAKYFKQCVNGKTHAILYDGFN